MTDLKVTGTADNNGSVDIEGADAGIETFEVVRKCVALFGVVSAIVFLSLVAVTVIEWEYFDAQESTTFMWVRASVLLLASPAIYRLTMSAARGSARSFDRLRVISYVVPVAIIAADLIPGLCTAWYAVMQALSVVPLIAAAVLLGRLGPAGQ